MIYLQSFGLSPERLSCPNIYPYNVFRRREGMVFFFEQITVLYGNNGSGKSTLLNQISNKLKIKGKEYATPNKFGNEDYCGRFVSECSYCLGEDELGRTIRSLPQDSRYIKSEDILYEIKKIQQKSVLEESLAYDQISDGKSKEEADDFLASKQGKQLQAYIMFAQEKYSNGETAFQFFEEFIRPNALYLLDEPEVSLSPSQFIIATHSPFMLGILNAKIYDLDSKDFKVSSWTELENVRYFYDFFEKHKAEFEEE